MSNLPETFEDLARLRQGMYKVFSAAFMPPVPERLGNLIAGADTLEGMGLPFLAFYNEWLPWRQALNSVRDVIDVEVEYVRMFATGVAGAMSPPTESSYTADPIRGEVGELLARLRGVYNDYRLEPTGAVADTLDHIAIELEVMSALCAREAEARGNENDPQTIVTLKHQRAFLEEHLMVWLPDFVERIAAADTVPFYSALGPAVASFVQHDLGVVRFLAKPSPAQEAVS